MVIDMITAVSIQAFRARTARRHPTEPRCLAHQLRDCQYAIEAGDEIVAPRMKTLLLRAVVLARRRMELAESTRRSYQRRLDRDLNAIMVTGSRKSARQATAKALRQEPKPLVHIPRPSRHTTRQQRQRTGTAANSYIPQGDRWFSIRWLCARLVAAPSAARAIWNAARSVARTKRRVLRWPSSAYKRTTGWAEWTT